MRGIEIRLEIDGYVLCGWMLKSHSSRKYGKDVALMSLDVGIHPRRTSLRVRFSHAS